MLLNKSTTENFQKVKLCKFCNQPLAKSVILSTIDGQYCPFDDSIHGYAYQFFLRIGYIYEQVLLKPDESFINYICPINPPSRGMF